MPKLLRTLQPIPMAKSGKVVVAALFALAIAVACTGPAGEQGPTGAAGQRGPQGVAGEQGPAGAAGLPAAEFSAITDVRDAVVLISYDNPSPPYDRITGSGVVISSTEILTSEHVVRGKTVISKVEVPGVGTVIAQVRGWDKGRDLALLTFKSGNFAPSHALLPKERELIDGKWDYHDTRWSPVVAVGYVPLISETSTLSTFGYIGSRWSSFSSSNPANPRISNIGIDAVIVPGMRGGGVFDVNGHLIGIIDSPNPLGFDHRAISWREINEVLAELRAGATNP